MSILLVFIEALILSAVFERQERDHRLELEIEYEKQGMKAPLRVPKLPLLESVANVVVGLLVLEFGGIFVWTTLGMIRKAGKLDAKGMGLIQHIMANQIIFAAAFLAGGIALVILGFKSIRVNMKYSRRLSHEGRSGR